MADNQKATEDRAERRVIDASKVARLAAGWKCAGWSRRLDGGGFHDGDRVEVTVELGTAAKFGDRVSVVLQMDAGQVGQLAKTCGADRDIVEEWLNENGSTTRKADERDADNLRLTTMVAKLRRRLAKVEAALKED